MFNFTDFIIKENKDLFPKEGKENILYLIKGTKICYIWSNEYKDYIIFANGNNIRKEFKKNYEKNYENQFPIGTEIAREVLKIINNILNCSKELD